MFGLPNNVQRVGQITTIIVRKTLPIISHQPSAGIRDTRVGKPTLPFTNVNQPEKHRLPVVPRVPPFWTSAPVKQPRGTKELYRMMGEELHHNKLQLKQFGIVAIHGGCLEYRHFEAMRQTIGRKLEAKKSFAIYRVPPPYKPVTRIGQGKRLGGGKGSIDHYMTPIKAGRVILEVGGKVSWEEVKPWLSNVAKMLPFEAIAVNDDILTKLDAEEKRLLHTENKNPITFEWLVRNNIRDCLRFVSPYDQKWFGKFVYKDRTLNKKWNIVRRSKYRSLD